MSSPDPQGLAVRTEGLVKRFGRETALAGVDLSVPEGAVYLLAGTNGAGKSTLLRTLLNIERPDRGNATILGLDSVANGPGVRARAGYVPETGEGIYSWMRAGRFLAHHAGYQTRWDEQYAQHLIRLLDVRLESRLGSLSKGQARRVQIVAALAHRPPVLLLDELTDGLDPLAREEVLGLLAAHLADTGATAILSTHLVAEVETLVDRVGVLRCGRLVSQAPAERLLARMQRYELDAPEGWTAPDALQAMVLRRESGPGKSERLVGAGAEAELVAAVASSGARVRDVTRLSLAEAIPILLQSEKSHAVA
jgi:ABC-2 type transport system ATP-binding protein